MSLWADALLKELAGRVKQLESRVAELEKPALVVSKYEEPQEKVLKRTLTLPKR